MKKSLLLGMMCAAAAGVFAQTAPQVLPYVYAQKISPDGRWILCESIQDGIAVCDRLAGEDGFVYYTEGAMSNGNVFANDGTCVGSTFYGDMAVIFKDGEMVPVEALADVSFCNLNGISADGLRICGTISNPEMAPGKIMYVPFCIDKDASGEYSQVKYLPYPETDFLGKVPQYVSAVWISNDGKTVLGQVIDASGLAIYPIVYKESASGEWSYSLPSESLLNPNHIELPEDPGDFEMTPPNVKNFMSPENQALYQQALDDWAAGGYQGEWPGNHPEEYMTPEEIEEYNAYVEVYNAYAEQYNAALDAYMEARIQIFNESVLFLQNGFALKADGSKFAIAQEFSYEEEGGDDWWPNIVTEYITYVFDTNDGSFVKYDNTRKDLIPNQILANGEVLGSTPANGEIPTVTYILMPGSTEYISLCDYLASTNPEANQWITDNLTAEVITGYDFETGDYITETMTLSGHAAASEDLSVIASGVMSYYLPDDELAEMGYMTYVLSGLQSGVKAVASADKSGVKAMRGGVIVVSNTVSNLQIADLSGRVLFNAPEAQGTIDTNINGGIYVVTYTDIEGNKVSKKVCF